jgi:hypothetical protein
MPRIHFFKKGSILPHNPAQIKGISGPENNKFERYSLGGGPPNFRWPFS